MRCINDFSNISVILWWSVLLVEETRVPREMHWPAASHRQTWSHNAVSRFELTMLVVIGTNCIGSYKSNCHTKGILIYVVIIKWKTKKYHTFGTVQKSRKTKNTTLLEQFKNLEKQKTHNIPAWRSSGQSVWLWYTSLLLRLILYMNSCRRLISSAEIWKQ